MTTVEAYIPKSEIDNFRKFVKKVQKNVPDMNISIGVERNKLYIHCQTFNGKRQADVKVWHPVFPVTIEMPEDSGWRLLATYKDGDFFATEMSKKLEFKNPAHGKDYAICDVCGHKCRNSYVVYNKSTGEELQVGCECAKKFGLDKTRWISKFIAELYRIYELNGISYSNLDDEEYPRWDNPDNFAFTAIPATDLIASAKAYYDENPTWKKGYREGRIYYKSESNTQIQHILKWNKFTKNEEYAQKVFKATLAMADDSEFVDNMKRLATDYYCQPADACYAFYMVKNYEDAIRAKEIGLDKMSSGMQVKVKGRVIDTHTEEGYYGTSTTYTIMTEKGFIAKRTGVIPITEEWIDDKNFVSRVEFYALVKYINRNEIILDRAVKHAKKGFEIIEL